MSDEAEKSAALERIQLILGEVEFALEAVALGVLKVDVPTLQALISRAMAALEGCKVKTYTAEVLREILDAHKEWCNVDMLERERDAARAQMRQLRDALMGLQDFECIECGLASEDDEPHRPDCVVGAALAAVWPEPKP